MSRSLATTLLAIVALCAGVAQAQSGSGSGSGSGQGSSAGGGSGGSGGAGGSGAGQGGAGGGAGGSGSVGGGSAGGGQSSAMDRSAGGRSGSAGQGSELNDAIAAQLLLGNEEEVVLAQFAQGRAQHQQVKEFAQMMMRDHQPAIQRLQGLSPQLASVSLQGAGGGAGGRSGAQGQGGHAGASGSQGGGAGGGSASGAGAGGSSQSGSSQAGGTTRGGSSQAPGEGASSPAGDTSQTASGTSGAGGAGMSGSQAGGDSRQQMLALHRSIAEQCVAMTQRELSEKNGPEFDMAYIGQQLVAHTQMLAKLQAGQQFASGELRSFIQEAIPQVQMHRDHAKQIAEQLKGELQGGASAAQRPGAPGGAQRQ